jgi:hypothetical protein
MMEGMRKEEDAMACLKSLHTLRPRGGARSLPVSVPLSLSLSRAMYTHNLSLLYLY